MNKLSLILSALLLTIQVQGNQRGQLVDGFAAEVNGRIITVADVIDQTRGGMQQLMAEHQGGRAELIRKQKALFLEGLELLIDRKLISEKFKSMGAQLPVNAVKDYKRRIIRERFNDDNAMFMLALKERGKTEREWDEELKENLIQQSMVQEYVSQNIQITPSQIREEYKSRSTDWRSDVELRLRAIAFRPAAEGEEQARNERIQTVRELLESGESFATVARKYSEGPKADSGGDQGWVRVDSLPPPIREPVSTLKTGSVSELVELPTQAYLFQVESRRGGETLPLADVQDDIESELRQRRQEELYDAWVKGLRDEFPVHHFDPDLSVITGE